MELSRGHTFLELIVVLALMGIVAAASVPYFRASSSIDRNARDVVKLVETARLYALHERIEASIRLNGSIVEVHTGNRLRGRVLLPAGTTAQLPDRHDSSFLFYPSGAATPGRMVLQSKGRRCEIVISLRSRTRWSCS